MENVKSFFTRNWAVFAYLFCGVFLVLGCNKLLYACQNKAETIGNEVSNEAVQQIKLNNEIQGLQKQIERLQDNVYRLDSEITRIDSLRFENLTNARNKSLHDNYSDLSKRYTKSKTVR